MSKYFLSPIVWLRRFRHRCGYGIHSPYAFSFVTDVVYERGQYYAYKELDELLPYWVAMLDLRPRKINRLLFRLTNWQHPKNAVFIGENAISLAFMKAAVPTATWQTGGVADLIYLEPLSDKKSFSDRDKENTVNPIDFASAGAMIVFADLRHQQGTWQELKKSERVTLSFDLYDVGVLLLDRQLNKAAYTICF